jgi:hypothetical protein
MATVERDEGESVTGRLSVRERLMFGAAFAILLIVALLALGALFSTM